MRYKNNTDEILKFRAHDSKGKKKIFELKPGKEIESDRVIDFQGLELVGKGKEKIEKKSKGDK